MASTKIYHDLAMRALPMGQQRHYKKIAEKTSSSATPPPPESFPLVTKILNGGIAGIAGISVVFPLDLVKTRLQNQTIGPNGEKQYTSIFDCFKKTMKAEGYFGMYRGAFINIVLVTPEKGVKFAANDYFRYRFTQRDGTLPLSSQGLAGGIAGLFQCMITTPMEMIKIQMQDAGRVNAQALAEGKKIKHVRATELISKLFRERGIFGLYRGIGPTAFRDIIYAAYYFPVVAFLDSKGPAKPGQKQPFWWSMIVGACAGASSAVIVNPLDVVKTRMQTLTKGKGEKHYTSVMECFTHTLKTEGPKAFLKGSLCRVIVQAPLYAITQAVYFYAVAERLLEYF